MKPINNAINTAPVPQAGTHAPTAKPGAPDPKISSDSFMRTPPDAAQLKQMRAAVAAVADLPEMPMGVAGKTAWLEQVRPAYAAADKALSGLRSASFFHKSPPEAEVDAASTAVYRLGDQIRDAEEATGQREPQAPANPFRPLFGNTDAVKGWMGNNAFTAVVGLIALPVAAMIDTVDAVTRPLQALAFPFQWGRHKIREARFEDVQAEKKAAAKP